MLPAGNSRLERLHAQVGFEPPGQIVDLHWRALPDDESLTFMEIWLPPGPPPAQSRISATPASREFPARGADRLPYARADQLFRAGGAAQAARLCQWLCLAAARVPTMSMTIRTMAA
jgi:hypothetical protein